MLIPHIAACQWLHCESPQLEPLQLCQHHAWLVHDEMARRLAAQAAPVPSHEARGTVYYLRLGDRIKIGWTASLGQRLRSYPPGHELLAAHRGTRADETALHQRCTPWRKAGREWYEPTDGLMRVVDEGRDRMAAETATAQREQHARQARQMVADPPPPGRPRSRT